MRDSLLAFPLTYYLYILHMSMNLEDITHSLHIRIAAKSLVFDLLTWQITLPLPLPLPNSVVKDIVYVPPEGEYVLVVVDVLQKFTSVTVHSVYFWGLLGSMSVVLLSTTWLHSRRAKASSSYSKTT